MPKFRSSLSSITTITSFLFVLGTGPASAEDTEFQYSGDSGPAHWSSLNPDWETCAGTDSGASQSPIDIRRIRVDWKLRRLALQTYPTTVDIFNNGHTIEQRYEDTGSSINVDGIDYELKQFHFHTLSEHTIRGQHAPLEMHAVFVEPGGNIVVVGQLFRIGRSENRFIKTLIDAGLPEKDGDETMTARQINLRAGLTNIAAYYTYNGSLTTPPCSEVVRWVVLKQPAYITSAQYEEFRTILGNNFRPLQKLNGRIVRATRLGHSWPGRPSSK